MYVILCPMNLGCCACIEASNNYVLATCFAAATLIAGQPGYFEA
jgi:hypothetical protein